MGVYVKGMEMPKGCAFCRIKRRNGTKVVCPLCDEGWDIHDPMSADHRLDNCPLRPVQPHGRLVDADALIRELEITEEDYHNGATLLMAVFLEVLKSAPTVIDAEEE